MDDAAGVLRIDSVQNGLLMQGTLRDINRVPDNSLRWHF